MSLLRIGEGRAQTWWVEELHKKLLQFGSVCISLNLKSSRKHSSIMRLTICWWYYQSGSSVQRIYIPHCVPLVGGLRQKVPQRWYHLHVPWRVHTRYCPPTPRVFWNVHLGQEARLSDIAVEIAPPLNNCIHQLAHPSWPWSIFH